MKGLETASGKETQLLFNVDLAALCEKQTESHIKRFGEKSYSRTIGIDARVLQFAPSMSRGIGHYTVNHLSALLPMCPDWKFVFCFDEITELPEALNSLLNQPNVSIKRFDEIDKPFDLFHIPDPVSPIAFYDSAFAVYPHGPYSVVFYDITPYVIGSVHFDQWSQLTQMGYLKRLARLKSPDVTVLSISEHTKKDLITKFNVPESNISTIMAGLNKANLMDSAKDGESENVAKRLGADKPYFMCVGALDTHKNFHATVSAYRAAKGCVDINLIVAGTGVGGFKDLWIDKLRSEKITGVIFADYLSRSELNNLYANAMGLVFPSLYEGFGFPVLEAMANGCPVITSGTSSIPEVAGNACILINPDDFGGIARSMIQLATSPAVREQMRVAGYAQAKKFTWESCAQKTVAAWNQFLDKRKVAIESNRQVGI